MNAKQQPAKKQADAQLLPAAQEATRLRILDAATEIFSEAGYRHATIREICGRAQVNIAAVNYHFGDKLALYQEVLRKAARDAAMGDTLTGMKIDGDPSEVLRAFVMRFLARIHDADQRSSYARLMSHEMAQPTEALPQIVKTVIQPNYDMLCALTGRIIDKPPKDATTRMCVHSMIGQIMHYVHAGPVIAHLWPQFKPTPAGFAVVADHITTFSIAALDAIRKDQAEKPRKLNQPATRKSKLPRKVPQ